MILYLSPTGRPGDPDDLCRGTGGRAGGRARRTGSPLARRISLRLLPAGRAERAVGSPGLRLRTVSGKLERGRRRGRPGGGRRS
ncbi:MAG: hypothetical protein MZV64_63340 [Ignavibacteriales bacterium]|nr:hypothetical protein [Ignavibacteriales bacterium]